jgi:hypothetical protein
MKPLILTNHALKQYASRTGRCENLCVAELFNSIRAGQQVSFKDAIEMGFKLTRSYKGDTYYVWYDPRIDEKIVAIIAKDGAIKTVMTINLYGYWGGYGEVERRYFEHGTQSRRNKNSDRRGRASRGMR